MSIEDAKKFYDMVASDKKLRDEIKQQFDEIQKIAKKHGCSFTHAEYFDHIHERTGMTKVGTSNDHDETDTCITAILSEPPKA